MAGGRSGAVEKRHQLALEVDSPFVAARHQTSPISFGGLLIQCADRVIRAGPGKALAEVHDYHDPVTPILAVSLQRRMPGCRELGFAKP